MSFPKKRIESGKSDKQSPLSGNDLGSQSEGAERLVKSKELQAAILAGIPESIARLPVEYAWGLNAMDKNWVTKSSSFAALYYWYFREHQVGDKQGFAITQGSLVVAKGCERKTNNAIKNYLVMVDFDSGHSLDEIKKAIRERGLFAIVYTTHSHGKSTSIIAQKALAKFLQTSGKANLAPDASEELTEQCRNYLLEGKKYHPDVVKGIVGFDKRPVQDTGLAYIVRHNAMTRARAVFVLGEPFDFAHRHTVMTDAHREWSERYAGFCASLELSYDRSCADPVRLMFLPRHEAGAPHQIEIIPGEALKIEEMPRLASTPDKKGARSKPAKAAKTIDRRSASFKTKNLKKFLARHATTFEIADFLRDRSFEERGPATNGGFSFACPNEDNHSDPSEGKTRFFVRDASQNEGRGFHIHCAGNTCSQQFAHDQDNSRQDRGKWLDFICQQVGIADATELEEYCLVDEEEGGIVGLPEGYEVRGQEIWYRDQFLCGMINIDGVARDENSANWSKCFSFRDPDGVRKELLIEDSELHGEVSEIAKKFASEGLRIATSLGGKRAFVSLLSDLHSDRRICRVSKPGFQKNGVFVPPLGKAIIPPELSDFESYVWPNQPQGFTKGAGGSFEEWQRAAAFAVSPSSPQIGLGLLLGACGPMIHLLELEPHGLFWTGPTSHGKSTAMIAQVGVWSDPDTAKGLRRAARTTANALETSFEAFNGTTGGIDDLQNGAENLAQDAVYMASNGQGRQRLTKEAKGRPVRTWEGYSYAFNAELSPSQLLNGRRPEVAGAYARCPVLDLADAPLLQPEAYTEMLTLFQRNFAHAGPLIIEKFLQHDWHRDPRELRNRYEKALSEIAKELPSAQRRAAIVFALMQVMGKFMIETAIIPAQCDIEACITWGWQQVLASEEFKKLAVQENASHQLLEWAAMSGDVFDVNTPVPVGRTPLAFRDQAENVLYLPESSLGRISCLGSTPRAAIAALKRSDALIKSSDRLTWKKIPGGPRVKHYRIVVMFGEDIKPAAKNPLLDRVEEQLKDAG